MYLNRLTFIVTYLKFPCYDDKIRLTFIVTYLKFSCNDDKIKKQRVYSRPISISNHTWQELYEWNFGNRGYYPSSSQYIITHEQIK